MNIEKIKQIFATQGGKYFLANRINKMIDNIPHTTYIEAFVGGGAVFFNKKNIPDNEILNDIDEDYIFMYKYVKNITDENIKTLKKFNWIANKATMKRVCNKLDKKKWKDDNEHFYLLRYKLKCNYGGKKSSKTLAVGSLEGKNIFKVSNYAKAFPRWRDRLKGVTILNKDAIDIIKEYDKKDNILFFLDPPYIGTTIDGFSKAYDEDNFINLIKTLKSLKNPFILTLSKSLKKYLDKSWKVATVSTPNILAGKGTDSKRYELVVSNIRPTKKFKVYKYVEPNTSIYKSNSKQEYNKHNMFLEWYIDDEYYMTSNLFSALEDNNILKYQFPSKWKKFNSEQIDKDEVVDTGTIITTNDKLYVQFDKQSDLDGIYNISNVDNDYHLLSKCKYNDEDEVYKEELIDMGLVSRYNVQKVDYKHRVIKGPVLIPNERDWQGDVITKDEIEKSYYKYAKSRNKKSTVMHNKKTYKLGNEVVELWLTEGITKFDGVSLPSGTMMAGIWIKNDKVWKDVLNGKLNGFSIGGGGHRFVNKT